MSTDYRPLKEIPFAELFDTRLEKYGVHEKLGEEDITERQRCLTDGRNYLWDYADEDGVLTAVTGYGWNAPGRILGAISETFGTEFVSEYEPQYWGFSTREEWHAAWDGLVDRDREELYGDLLKYLHGESNAIEPGTNGRVKARIGEE